MRAQAQARMVKKITQATQKSEEKRAAAEARRSREAVKTTYHVFVELVKFHQPPLSALVGGNLKSDS